jgi:hypothetical protein
MDKAFHVTQWRPSFHLINGIKGGRCLLHKMSLPWCTWCKQPEQLKFLFPVNKKKNGTGKSFSEALLFAEHGENMLCTKIVLNVKQFLYTTSSPQV